jgi:predicted amidohydrolase YtcJ
MRRSGIAVLVAAAALAAALVPWRTERVVYLGGPILPMDATDSIVAAVAIEGDRIVGVGSEEELRAWGDANGARVVDLNGRALLPGFIDAHGHFPGEGLYSVYADLNSPPVGNVQSMDDLVEVLAAKASETRAGRWVVGISYDDSLLADKRHPTRHDLDRASTAHPIIVWHISLHFASANSLALAELGIDADTKDPKGGVIRRDASTGEPDGFLEENATTIARQLGPQPSLLEAVKIARECDRRYLRNGVTTAQSGYADQQLVSGLPILSRLGLIDVRLIIWPGDTVQDEVLDGKSTLRSYDPQWVTHGAVKLVTDGSIQGYTGYLSKPYHVAPGDDPSYRGYARIARDELIERVGRYHRAGLQIAAHGNGDAAIDNILDAFEIAQGEHARGAARHVIIHAQMARDDQLDRMADLGVIPSFFVLHTFYWGDRHRELFLGPERTERISPLRAASDRNIRFTIHADSPVVPMEPLRLVWSAVNRQTRSGRILGQDQRISTMQALRATTIDAAHQHFEEDQKGSIEVGKLADLVILSRSPLDDPSTIADIDVVETIIGGRTLYRR